MTKRPCSHSIRRVALNEDVDRHCLNDYAHQDKHVWDERPIEELRAEQNSENTK